MTLVQAAFGQAFGRFGYHQRAQLPGFVVDRSGFRTNHPSADTFRFPAECPEWTPLTLDETEINVTLGGTAGGPATLRASLLSPGFSLYFRESVSLRLNCNSAPFLTWDGGSVGVNTPTPDAKWILLSFRDNQPPVLFVGSAKTFGLQVTGRTGDWRVESTEPFQGWVNVIAPLGTQGHSANSAATLGGLVKDIKAHEAFWTQNAPKVTQLTLTEEAEFLTAVWEFDKPGAMAPSPLRLAPLGGYRIEVEPALVETEAWNEFGPICYVPGRQVRVRFPIRRIPAGRGIAIGESEPLIGSASPIDPPTLFEYALSLLSPASSGERRDEGRRIFQTFLTETTFSVEPFSGQQLPYDARGRGMDLVAAHALLTQCLDNTESSSEPNSLLTSLRWRRDWTTWRTWVDDPLVMRRSTALAAIAGALCPEPRRRLEAAMFQAGLCAERGLVRWRYHRDLGPRVVPIVETLPSLREAIFRMPTAEKPSLDFLRALASEVRIYSDQRVSAEAAGLDTILAFASQADARFEWAFATAYPVTARAIANIESLRAAETPGYMVLTGRTPLRGEAKVALRRPDWSAALPPLVAIPRWEEIARE